MSKESPLDKIGSQKLNLYKTLLNARTVGNKNSGRDRAKSIRPLLNILVGKECDWNELQCARCFENLLRKYIEPDRIDQILATAGYDERYPQYQFNNAKKRRDAYIKDKYEGHQHDAPQEDTLESYEYSSITSMSVAIYTDYEQKQDVLIATVLTGFSSEELLALGLKEAPNQEIIEESVDANDTISQLTQELEPTNAPHKNNTPIITATAGILVLLAIITIVILLHNKPPEGKSAGGDPPRLDLNWGYIDSDGYYLGYGIMSVMNSMPKAEWDAKKDYQEELKANAESGKAWAQFELGSAYLLLRDYEQAYYWIERAADQNHTSSQALLSIMYINGIAVEQDDNKAFKWAMLAAQQDNPAGQLVVAEMYRLGYGKTMDLKESAFWYEKALEHGHYALAEYRLAEYYETAEAGNGNIEKALSLYAQAYSDGVQEAAIKLAGLYEEGPEEIRDISAAIEWYRKLGYEDDVERCEKKLNGKAS